MSKARTRRSVTANPFNRFSGTKMELLQAGASILSWDYRRASKDDHKLGKSVDDQGTDNARQEERQGWTHTKTFQDNDLGASRQAKQRGVVREEFQLLLDAIRNGEPGDVLVLWELSRRERDMAIFVQIRDLCVELGPFFWLVGGELYDVRSRHDRSILGFQAQQAESGADAISEGVLRGLAANAEQGKPHGPVPFGYRRIYHPRTHKFVEQVPDEDGFYTSENGDQVPRIDGEGARWSPAGVVRDMYEDALAYVPIKSIVAKLNARGVPTPRQLAATEQATPLGPERWRYARWSQNAVRRLLLNPANIGIRTSFEEVAKTDCWPGIVTEEVFFAVSNFFADPSRVKNPYAGQQTRARYLLSRIARCWVCKGRVSFDKGREDKPNRAGCRPMYKCENNCASIPQITLEDTVVEYVIARLSDSNELNTILALDSAAPEIQAARAESERLRADLADTGRRIRIAAREDMDDLEARRDDQRKRLLIAESKMASTNLPSELNDFVGSDLDECWGTWRILPLAVKRNIVRATVEIWVFPAGKGRSIAPLNQRLFIEFAARTGESGVSDWAAKCEAARDARIKRARSGTLSKPALNHMQ